MRSRRRGKSGALVGCAHQIWTDEVTSVVDRLEKPMPMLGSQGTPEKPADWDEHYEWPYDRSRRVCMKILGDPNPVVRALGLDITLPNSDAIGLEPWDDYEGLWKIPLRGLIADTCEPNGDTDWALLLAPVWGRVWFDLEEGVIVYFPVENIAEAASLVATLRAHDMPLTFPDGMSRVWVMPVAIGDDAAPDVEARIEAAGFAPDNRRSIWTPVAA
jgi:hypothetical protein